VLPGAHHSILNVLSCAAHSWNYVSRVSSVSAYTYRVRLNVNAFIFASLPAALIGVWNLGAQLKLAPPSSPQPWQLAWLEVGFGTPESLPAVVLGAAFFLPLLFTALVVSRVWAELFAKRRDRPLDSGWAVTAWLFTLLLPASMPLPYAVLGLCFGGVGGGHVVGGTGR
jgi:Na+-transporting NADH:ubiquinone oxidoreductase subunit NqrB